MQRLIESFSSINFRNLQPEHLSFSPGLNLFLGPNGQGKTNFLEALAVLGNMRSFRGADTKKMSRVNSSGFRLEGRIRRGNRVDNLEQIVEMGTPAKRQLFFKKRQIGVAEYLQCFPVFPMSPQDTKLVRGAPKSRRALLDRMVFFSDASHLNHIRNYQRSLQQRNAALQRSSDTAEMELWEDNLAKAAARIVESRIRVFKEWKPVFHEIYHQLRGEGFPDLEIYYRWEGPEEELSKAELVNLYRERYNRERGRDRRLGFTMDGPHRHDLHLRVGDRPLRDFLSSGQIKVVSVALSFSGLKEVETRRGEFLPVLFDDIDAELDACVLQNLVEFFGAARQIFITSAHGDSIKKLFPKGLQFQVRSGRAVNEVSNE